MVAAGKNILTFIKNYVLEFVVMLTNVGQYYAECTVDSAHFISSLLAIKFYYASLHLVEYWNSVFLYMHGNHVASY